MLINGTKYREKDNRDRRPRANCAVGGRKWQGAYALYFIYGDSGARSRKYCRLDVKVRVP